MRAFTLEDTNPMSWNEFNKLTDILVNKITNHFIDKKNVHVISPLLRSGGIVGSVLAVKMEIIPLLPVQFKYSYNPTKITQLISIPEILTDLPEEMNIILAEGNTNSGSIATEAAKAIKDKYPKAKMYLATLTKVFGGPEELENIESIFYGKMTDENFIATDQEKKEFQLRNGITIFPWEKAENELADINA